MPKEFGGEFEMNSVMMYGTSGFGTASVTHVTKKNDEQIFGGDRITTVDSLQINYKYCRDKPAPMNVPPEARVGNRHDWIK